MELALHGVGTAWDKQTRDGALLLLADDGTDRFAEQLLRAAHVLAVLRHLLEPGAGRGIGKITSKAQPLEPVQYLLRLGKRQQNGAVIANMDDVMRSEGVAW